MFLLRLLLWIVTLPIRIIALVLKLILVIITSIGSIFSTLVGGLLFLASLVMLVACFWYTGEDFWNGFGTAAGGMALGLFVYFLPKIGVFLVNVCEMIVDWCRSISF